MSLSDVMIIIIKKKKKKKKGKHRFNSIEQLRKKRSYEFEKLLWITARKGSNMPGTVRLPKTVIVLGFPCSNTDIVVSSTSVDLPDPIITSNKKIKMPPLKNSFFPPSIRVPSSNHGSR